MKSFAELMAGAMRKAGVPMDTSPEARRARQESYDAEKRAAHAVAEKRRADTFGLHLGRCGVPERIAGDASAPGLRDTAALAAVKRWMGQKEGHLVLSGWTGTGKSVAAAWAFRGALRPAPWGYFEEQEWDDRQCLWLPYGVLARMSDFDDEDRRTLARACRARWLVLDDVGLGDAAEPPAHVRTRLELLADARDAPGVRTVWTTNKALVRQADGSHEFGRFVGQRIYSRIARSVLPKDCGADDLRVKR